MANSAAVKHKKSNFQGAKINPTRFHRSQIKFFLVVGPIALFMLLPVMFIVSQAFKPLDELYRFPPTFIVERPTMANFRSIFDMTVAGSVGVPMSRFLKNTIFVTIVTVGLTICVATMAQNNLALGYGGAHLGKRPGG